MKFLGQELENPARPFVVILGGAKVSDKIKVIDRLLEKADTILIGGAMAYTFNLAQGFKVGKSLVEPDKQDLARAALEKAKARGVQFLLPTRQYHRHAGRYREAQQKRQAGHRIPQSPTASSGRMFPDQDSGLDIGPETVKRYCEIIRRGQDDHVERPDGDV